MKSLIRETKETRKTKEQFWLFTLILIFLLNFLHLFDLNSLLLFEYQFYDYIQQHGIAKSPKLKHLIVTVGINDADLQQFPSTIPDDNTLADLISKISEQNPAVIGLDIIRDLPVGKGKERLEKIFRETKNLYGVGKFTGIDGDSYFHTFAPPPVLLAEGRVGDASLIVDEDGVIRRGNLFPIVGDNPQPSFSLVLAQHYLEDLGYEGEISPQGYWQFGEVVFRRFESGDGGYTNADDSGYQILMNWYNPPQSLPTVSLTDVLSDNIPDSFFTNKIVLIGYTTITLKQDIAMSPFSRQNSGTPRSIFGVEVYGNVIDYLIHTVVDNQPVLSAISSWLETLIISFFITLTVFLIFIVNRFQAPLIFILLGLLISVILSAIHFFLNYHLFIRGFWLPIFGVGAIIFTGITTLFYLLTTRIIDYINNLEQKVKLKTQDLLLKNEELNDKIKLIEIQQEQLINQEKLAFLGRLTAGFCHQFKNPFYITKYTIDSGIKLLNSYDLDEDFIQFKENLQNARISMDKLELLSKLILISPTRNKLFFIEAKPNEFVENIMISAVKFHSLEQESNLQNQIELEKAPTLKTKIQIPQQLEIPVFNLIDNAIDAILAKEAKENNFQGFIQVRTKNNQDYWQIIVEDNGGGIPPKIKEKLFKPFVTSKADKDGIGLGLWISREMMINLIKGEISVESKGQKTKFQLNVPFF